MSRVRDPTESDSRHCRWEASLNNQFASWTLGDAKKILGTRMDNVFAGLVPVADTIAEAIPAAFDSRLLRVAFAAGLC